MNPRSLAVNDITSRKSPEFTGKARTAIEQFGHLTFQKAAMQKVLPKEAFNHMVLVMEGKVKLNTQFADKIANGMKDWAIMHGATHYCHWFQPLTGHSAEKHDAFIDWSGSSTMIEKFSGKLLLRGEPDASSFPSGGLRRTSQARGYTTWDPTTPVFLWKMGNAVILCIPSLFFSWKGDALDMKIPLMRSEMKISEAVLRLMRALGIPASQAYATLGPEQEYFLVDRSLCLLRPDLLLSGRTVCGSAPPKGQELEDHYFRSMKERILSFVQDFEAHAYNLGIPLKTRHGEVAPGQYEVAPIYERASIAVDHNVLLMELMKEVAHRHGLVCLMHEKPFAGINGSGKHCNWSVATDTGLNLFDPTDSPGDSLSFLIMVAALLGAVHRHGALLRTSISSAGNDHRLGGNEAPPPIISVCLGTALEELLDSIEKESSEHSFPKGSLDLKIATLAEIPKDYSDRNRTSPFAFTGNKFEFRAVGASANCAIPITVLNSIVAEQLHMILDDLEPAFKGARDLKKAAMPVIRKYLKASKNICFSGDGYSSEWVAEAKKRGLPVIERSFHAFKVLLDEKTRKVFQDVLSKEELQAHYTTMLEHYCKIMNMEAKLLVEIFQTQILPASLQYQKEIASSIDAIKKTELVTDTAQIALFKKLHHAVSQAALAIDILEETRQKTCSFHEKEMGESFCDDVSPKMAKARQWIDTLETLLDDRLWPLPKYRELLFLV